MSRFRWPLVASVALSGLLAVDVAAPATALSTTTAAAPATATTAVLAARATGVPLPKGDITSALLQARLEHKRVEVTDSRTETRTLWANPDGTLTEDHAAGPVRFRADDGTWTAVDVSLTQAADGTVEAKAHPLDLTLGRATPARADAPAARRLGAAAPVAAATPLVSLTSPEGEQIELGWRGALPAPRLDGTRATYPGALPHADLVVSATRTGFEQFLMLNSRQAVEAAGTLRMTLTAKGLTAKADADGGVTFADSRTGKPAGTLPAPVMWDARTDERSGEHPYRAPVAMSVAQQGDRIDLTLTPDAAFLADPATRFPVTVDPAVGLLTTFTTFVQEGYTTDQSTATELKLGNNGSGQVARSFLRFDTRAVKGKDVRSATLKLWNHHSWSCQARDWQVWDTGTPGTATRWTAQPAWNRLWATSAQTKGFGTGCADGWVAADLTALARAWAANAHDQNTLGIRAADEKDPYGWKRFHSRNAPTNVPVLSVTYNNPPGAPTATALSPSSYNSFNKRTYATSLTPTFSAKVADPDGGTVRAQFEVTPDPAFNDAGTYSWTGTSGAVASGGTAMLRLPDDKKLGAFGYRVRSRAHDGSVYGAWSAYVPFRVNTAKPAAPQIDCTRFPRDTWTDSGGEISCTLTTTSTDGRGYLWGLDNPNTPQQVNDPAGTGGKPQTVKINPAQGWHTLHARTVDSAGLLSGITAYQFGKGPKPAALPTLNVPGALQEGAQDTPTPVLSGVVTSGNRGAYLHGEFALYDATGTPLPGVQLPPSFQESGQRVATLIPEGTLVPGRAYQWAMRACGDTACSGWTPKRTFTAKAAVVRPAPPVRTVDISGAALRDATAPVGPADCGTGPCAAVEDGTLRVGTPGGTAWRSWFKANLSAVPAGARITDARLRLHRADCATGTAECTEPAATVHDLAEAWDPTHSGQALAAAADEEPLLADDELPTALGDLNLGALVADWLPEADNHGLSLQLGDERTAGPGVVYHSSRAADKALRPVLTVSYVPSGAPGAPENVKAVPADGGLLATWNPPADPGAATDALTYTVAVHRGGTEVARTTTGDTRAVFGGLTNGADHTVTVTADSPHGTSKAAVPATAKPVAVAGQERYAQAVRDYFAARAGVLKGTYTTVEQATASSPHGAMFRELIAQQLPELNGRREAYARHERRFTEITTAFDDVLTGPGPDNTVVVRATVSESSVLTHTDGTQEPEEGELPGRFVFADGALRIEANDTAVEVTLPTTGDVVRDASVAPPAEERVEDLAEGEEALPIVLDSDGMLAEEPVPGTTAMRLAAVVAAAPSASGTANWAKRNANIKYDYENDCANFVSKALHYGGKMKQRKGGRKNQARWFRNNLSFLRLDSYTWAAAANLRQHLKNYRGGREISRYDARPGDVIFGFYRTSKAWNHTGVITAAKGGKINITQHGRSHHTTLNQWFKNNKNLSAISIIRPGKRS
ncbi:DNRLRE domain-containing protein [Kitasatospora albolonga]|uniref:DNRLRE domain-containing protein n=1 Tax=Kitasatospora albolonga TaxID=68173 RepID=UPI00131C9F8F